MGVLLRGLLRLARVCCGCGRAAGKVLFMPRPRVISAKNRPFKHVELSDGDWINLKVKLNYGESSDLYDATYKSAIGGDRGTAREVRMSQFNMNRIFIYTLEWSFIDDEQKPLPLSVASIMLLDMETTEEIHNAINAMEAEQERIDNAAKRGAPVPAVAPTAPVPVAAVPATATNSPSPVSSPPSQVSASPPERSG
jgi:hypothetical protein